MGLKGDLTAGEIVEQLVHACRVTTIKNVVYMVGRIPLTHHFTSKLRNKSWTAPTAGIPLKAEAGKAHWRGQPVSCCQNSRSSM